MLPGASWGGCLPLSWWTIATAATLPMALATFPDFGTGRPIVESPTTWTFGALADSNVR